MEFVLIRHTRCAVAAGTCYGHLDVPLASTATEDVERTLAQVPPVDLVVCSPSQRCHVLGRELAKRDRCAIRTMPALQELDFGKWEGRPWHDIPRSESDAWATDPWNRAPPDGETERELWERTAAAAALLQTTDATRIGIVSHGGPLRILRCLLTQRPADERWSQSIGWGEVVRIACSEPLQPTVRPAGARAPWIP